MQISRYIHPFASQAGTLAFTLYTTPKTSCLEMQSKMYHLCIEFTKKIHQIQKKVLFLNCHCIKDT